MSSTIRRNVQKHYEACKVTDGIIVTFNRRLRHHRKEYYEKWDEDVFNGGIFCYRVFGVGTSGGNAVVDRWSAGGAGGSGEG